MAEITGIAWTDHTYNRGSAAPMSRKDVSTATLRPNGANAVTGSSGAASGAAPRPRMSRSNGTAMPPTVFAAGSSALHSQTCSTTRCPTSGETICVH
jgi:hypothetical protein